MRRILALLVLLTLLFSTRPAHAQGGGGLSSVSVQIWPEYDRPSALVIYHIMVAPETSLPATLTFRIPAAAQKPHALAIGDTPSTVSDLNVQYTTETAGDWINVEVVVTGPAITLEYYDPALTIEGRTRRFTYQWPGDYSVGNFTVQVQQPYDASQLQSTPALTNAGTFPDKLTYHVGDFGALAQGQSLTLDVSYQKASDSLTVSLMPVEPSAPVDVNTPGRVSLATFFPWLLGGAGVLLIAGGLYYYFRGFRTRALPRQAHKRHHVTQETAEVQIYCHQCGSRARPGDRFCRTCGTRLRAETEE